uniref:Thymocyte selection associated family member 2 n=1 Tax=Leptobrachium leishanense TaxID=445787 RepID=A0A8C5LU65_9ANUR
MEEVENAVPLEVFVASMSSSSLPRILKITSGVYLQSSVYDIQGTECCLSTGDVVKVVSKHLVSLTCMDPKTGECHNLPLEFKGIFQVSADKSVYNTFGELHRELTYSGYTHPFWFSSMDEIDVGDQVIRKQVPIQYISTCVYRENRYANCQVYEEYDSFSVKIPFMTQGQFCETQNKESFTLEEILQSPVLMSHNLMCSDIGKGSYSLSPVYEILTIMHMRKDPVRIPSSLEVDVIDITDTCEDVNFIKPMSLAEISMCEDKLPVVAEILESSKCSSLIKNDIFLALRKGQKVIIQKKTLSRKVLTIASKGKRSSFFYIYDAYQGKFRQRPREFSTIYDLWIQAKEGFNLKVVVTQDCDSSEGSYPSLYIGDHLQVLHQTKNRISSEMGFQDVDLLVCRRESGDDEEESEEISLPLFLEGRFVEEVTNNKRYSLSNLIKVLKLPSEVKVVAKDQSMNSDPLTSFAFLRLEELIEEPALLVSFFEDPSECFELPIKYSDFSFILLDDLVPPSKELQSVVQVEELTESFYYEVRKQLPSNELPPPRPPKRQVKAQSTCNTPAIPEKAVLTTMEKGLFTESKLIEKQGSKNDMKLLENNAICTKNTYSPPPWKHSPEKAFTYDHDYEQLDEELIKNLNIKGKKNY